MTLMPYIARQLRTARTMVELRCLPELVNAGGLNYVLTQVCLAYLCKHGHCYQRFNDIIGALEGAKLEMYRRMVGPYEDEKKTINGDVYPTEETNA